MFIKSIQFGTQRLIHFTLKLTYYCIGKITSTCSNLYHPICLFVGVVFTGGIVGPLSYDFIFKGKLPSLTNFSKFLITPEISMIVLLILLLFLIVFLLAYIGNYRIVKERKLQEYFRLCKKTENLAYEDLGFTKTNPQEAESRNWPDNSNLFFGTYFSRKVTTWAELSEEETGSASDISEDDLKQHIASGQGFLLIGPPFSGKTLTLFELLRDMKDFTVICPNDKSPIPPKSTFALLRGRKVVILLDDIASMDPGYDLRLFSQRLGNPAVVGTCRGGVDFEKILIGHGDKLTRFCEGLRKYRLHLMTRNERIKLAETAGFKLGPKEAWFRYPLPGRITMRKRIENMVLKFHSQRENNKDVLRAIKLLYSGGITLTFFRLQEVLRDVFKLNLPIQETSDILKQLWDEHFLLKQPSIRDLGDCIDYGILELSVSYVEGFNPKERLWYTLIQVLENAKDVGALLQLGRSQIQGGCRNYKLSLKAVDRALDIEPDNSNAHFLRGYNLAWLNDFKNALLAIERALDICPDFAKAHNFRGHILSLRGNLKGAQEAFMRALEIRPNYADAHTNMGAVLTRQGKEEDALKEFNKALGIRTNPPHVYLIMGISLSRQDDFEKALKAFDKALNLRPKYPEVYLNQGITFARAGKYEEAKTSQKKAIELRSNYAEAHMHLGQTFANLKEYKEAVIALTKAIEIQPEYYWAYRNRSRTFYNMEQYNKALSDNNFLLDLRPNDAEVRFNRGNILVRLNSSEDAIKAYKKAIDINPEYAEAYLQYGAALADNDRLPEALNAINKAIDLCPDYPEAHMKRGITLSRMDKFNYAKQAYEKAIEIRPNYVEAYVQYGITLASHKFYVHALDKFNDAIKLCPNHPEAHMRLGITLSHTEGGLDLAIEAIEKAIDYRPDFADAYWHLSITLSRKKESLDLAIKAVKKAIHLRPDFAHAHMSLGILLARSGRFDEAIEAHDQALRHSPQDAEILVQKAKTLCLHQDVESEALRFQKSIDLLEQAVAITPGIVKEIQREGKSGFTRLAIHQDYGSLFDAITH